MREGVPKEIAGLVAKGLTVRFDPDDGPFGPDEHPGELRIRVVVSGPGIPESPHVSGLCVCEWPEDDGLDETLYRTIQSVRRCLRGYGGQA